MFNVCNVFYVDNTTDQGLLSKALCIVYSPMNVYKNQLYLLEQHSK